MATSIAIVDEDRELAAALAGELRNRRYEVVTATSVQQALELLSERRVDVLVTELRVGNADGLELLSALRSKSPETRAVLISAHASVDDYKRALKLGAVELLTKPLELDAVLGAIQTAADCDRGFRGNLHGITLVDLVQMLHFSKRSVTVHLGEDGAIHMRDGEIVHARIGFATGKQALAQLLAADSGTVRTTSLETEEQTIVEPLSQLLLDTLRQVDEENAGATGGIQVDETTLDDLFGDDSELAWETMTSRGAASGAAPLPMAPAPGRVSAPRATPEPTGPFPVTPNDLAPQPTGGSNHPTGPFLPIAPTVGLEPPFKITSSGYTPITPPLSPPMAFGADGSDTAGGGRGQGSSRRAMWPLLLLLLLATSALVGYWLARGRPQTHQAATIGPGTTADRAAARATARPAVTTTEPVSGRNASAPASGGASAPAATAATVDTPSRTVDQPSATRQLVLRTTPPGLVLRDAKTGRRLGRSPVTITVRAADLPLRVQAMRGDQVSPAVLAAETLTEAAVTTATVDFEAWASARRASRPRVRARPRRRTRPEPPVRQSVQQEKAAAGTSGSETETPPTEERADKPAPEDTLRLRKRAPRPRFDTVEEAKPTMETVD